MKDDLSKIKDKYGEKMAHLCRDLFPTILETEGLLFKILSDKFNYSKFLYDDLAENNLVDKFKNYIYSFIDVENKCEEVTKSPKELLSDAGYILYECKSEEDIQKFRKYYKKGEELCTFDGGRLDSCHVFFAVKKNVEEIRREDFSNPKREDLYGTSVISIQFSRGDINTLSIKNRYNHRVHNPDATFSNNLDNIIEGLTFSFEKEYNLNINSNRNNFEIPNYVLARDGKYYKYNYEINNIYYCPDNIIIDNFRVVEDYQDKSRFLMLDYFILDMKEKIFYTYDYYCSDDSFLDAFDNIEKISINKEKNGDKCIDIVVDGKDVQIILNKENRIISYKNENLTEIGNKFLNQNDSLKDLNLPNVVNIGEFFLEFNEVLENIYLPQLSKVGYRFLFSNRKLIDLELPNIKDIDDMFLYSNRILQSLYVPNLEFIGKNFLALNLSLKNISFPNVRIIGDHFLYWNQDLKSIYAPNLLEVHDNFLLNNMVLEEINAPKLRNIGNRFLKSNFLLVKLELPEVRRVGYQFLYDNVELEELYAPNLFKAGNGFLYNNYSLKKYDISSLTYAGGLFIADYNGKVKVKKLCCNNK